MRNTTLRGEHILCVIEGQYNRLCDRDITPTRIKIGADEYDALLEYERRVCERLCANDTPAPNVSRYIPHELSVTIVAGHRLPQVR